MSPEDVKRLDALVAGVKNGSVSRDALASAIAEAGYTGADLAFYSNLRGQAITQILPGTFGASTALGAIGEALTPEPAPPVNRTRQAVDEYWQTMENKGPAGFTAGAGGSSAAPGTDAFTKAMIAAGWVPTDKPGVWFNPESGKTFDQNDSTGGGSGAGSAGTYATIAENARQFDITRADQQARFGVTDAQWQKSYHTGVDQFNRNFARSSFESDRAFNQARDQFAQQFAQSQYQYDQSRADSNAQFGATFDLNQRDMGARYATQAETAGLEQSRFERQQGLAEKKNTQEILRNPSDYIARAFESRGGTSPDAKVTQADLINAMRADSAAASAQGADYVNRLREIAGRFANVTPYTPPAGQRPAAAAAPAAPAPAPAPVNTGSSGPNGPAGGSLQNIGGNAVWVPAAEHGGTFGSNMVMTGDSSDGKENEELVIDLPNDGGLMVIPKDRLVGKRKRGGKSSGTPSESMFANVPHMENGGFLPQNFDAFDPKTYGTAPSGYKLASWASDPMSVRSAGSPYIKIGGASDPAAQATFGSAAAPASANYTAVTQEQLVADAQRLAPPAITSVLAGGKPPAFRAAQPNLTPRKLAMMTESERTALNSYLGVVNNTTLADEMQGQASLFGPAISGPRARLSMSGGR